MSEEGATLEAAPAEEPASLSVVREESLDGFSKQEPESSFEELYDLTRIHGNPNDPMMGDSSDYDSDTANLPPGRMKATRVKERLSGGHLIVPPTLMLMNNTTMNAGDSNASIRSRSKSPHTGKRRGTGGETTTTDANSSISSLEDIVDQDILYDRAGFAEDYVASETFHHRRNNNSRESFGNLLTPVSERMCEDTLEDVHAFSDVPRSSNASRCNSTTTGNDPMLSLAPLNECDDESVTSDDDSAAAEGGAGTDAYHHHHHHGGTSDTMGNSGGGDGGFQVILTNLDHLSMGAGALEEEEDEDDDDDEDGASNNRPPPSTDGIGGGSSVDDDDDDHHHCDHEPQAAGKEDSQGEATKAASS